METRLKSSKLFKISDKPEKISSFTAILYNKEIVVEDKKDVVEEDVQSKPKPTRMCFNCGGGDHSLKECTEPYNPRKIARNRTAFNGRSNKLSQKIMEFTRYHKEIDDRFSDFRPGKLSNNLRAALGLKKDTLPRYIYNMRRLGYPPGWLEEAKITNSGINMLDSNGERVPDSDEEEGEICSVRVKYDPLKIIDYPGFNVWPDPGTINETEAYGSLPMCYDQNKEVFIERLNNCTYNNDNTINLENNSDIQFYEEMEVEELDIAVKFDEDKSAKFGFIPPLPDETEQTPPPPPPPPPNDEQSSNDDEKNNINIANRSEGEISEEEEGELRSTKEAKSNRNKGSEKTSNMENSPECSSWMTCEERVTSPPSSIAKEYFDESLESPRSEPESSNGNTSKALNRSTSVESMDTFGRIKSIELGTPVLNHSSYTALPSPEKFRKDISDVIYFENLPNSTGTYERLKGILKNVRTKLSTLRGCTDSKK